jgi:DNA-binding HxlR family transcriptional regulator
MRPTANVAANVARNVAATVPPSAPALDAALGRVGDRWSLLVVAVLLTGPRRFNDLLDEVGAIAPNVLSHRLKHLEHQGVIVSAPYSRRPLRLRYQLTASGLDLADALRMLARWGSSPVSGEPAAAAHTACGTPLETRWFCPTCARVVEDSEGDGLTHL